MSDSLRSHARVRGASSRFSGSTCPCFPTIIERGCGASWGSSGAETTERRKKARSSAPLSPPLRSEGKLLFLSFHMCASPIHVLIYYLCDVAIFPLTLRRPDTISGGGWFRYKVSRNARHFQAGEIEFSPGIFRSGPFLNLPLKPLAC